MAIITLDYKKSNFIAEKLHSLDEKQRSQLHLTDDPEICGCSLKAFCRLHYKFPAKYSRKTAGIFMRGILYDELFKRPFNAVEVEKKIGFVVTQKMTGFIVAHPDVVLGKYPIEAKHTTRIIQHPSDIPACWITQLTLEEVYCKVRLGWLVIGDLQSTLVTAWKVKIDKEEEEHLLEGHVKRMSELASAIYIRRHSNGLKPNWSECPSCYYNYVGGCPERKKV